MARRPTRMHEAVYSAMPRVFRNERRFPQLVSRATNLVARETNLVRHEATPHRGNAQAPAIKFDTNHHSAIQRGRDVVARPPTDATECLRCRSRTTSVLKRGE